MSVDKSPVYNVKAIPVEKIQANDYNQQQFQFALSSMIIAVFLACFLIGFFVRSKKMADFTIGILLIIFSLLWCMIGFLIPIFTQHAMTILWVVLLIVALGGSIHTIWKSRKL